MVGARLQLWALVGLAFVAGVLGIYMAGVQRGIDRQREKLDAKRLTNFKTAKEIEDEINSDPYLADRASKWVRHKE
jgi:hypothetical protein